MNDIFQDKPIDNVSRFSSVKIWFKSGKVTYSKVTYSLLLMSSKSLSRKFKRKSRMSLNGRLEGERLGHVSSKNRYTFS